MKRGIVLFLMLWGITLAVLGQDTLKVMTYNVRHCAGMNLVLDYDRTAAVIARQQPDVVALQELDSMTGQSKQRYQLVELASRTGYHPVLALPLISMEANMVLASLPMRHL